MNKFKKIVLVLLIILAIIVGLTYTTFAVTGRINVETVRIRQEASKESKTLIMGDLGENLEILGEENGWYKVNYKGTEGYVYKDYVETSEEVNTTSNEPEETQPPEEPVENTEPISEEIEDTKPVETTTTVATELGDTLNKDSNAYLLPNYTSTKIAELKVNEQVKIITTLANWAKIESDSKEAWIPKTLLMKEVAQDSTITETPETTEETTTLNQAAYISSNTAVNLREGPSTDTVSLGKLQKNTKITVISEENDWYKVNYNGQEGYISKPLVTIGEPPAEEETSSRSSTVSRTSETIEVAPASAGATSAASIAQQYIGYSYVYGGSSPAGFDCSGFTSYVYSQAGISLSRTSYAQASQGTAVSKAELQPGDLVVFSGANHVGIYVGNGQFVHASNPSLGVRYDSLDSGYWANQYQSARRF